MFTEMDEDLTKLNIDDLFKDPDELDNTDTTDTTTSNSETTENTEVNKKKTESTEETKAVSQRINEVKRKTESETQEKIAKELGYSSYADLKKESERKIIADAGLDEDDIHAVVDKLVEKRLADDPRFKKLDEIEQLEKKSFVSNQLNEINSLFGKNYTSVDKLPKDVLKLWETTGNLKQAYLAIHGEDLLNKTPKRTDSLEHLASGASAGGAALKSRALTEYEKAIWRSVFPDITDDELAKKTVDIEQG